MSMSRELHRQATYSSWPNNSSVSPLSLARLGFYSVRNGDEVECFQCKTRLKELTGIEDTKGKHNEMAPHCRLFNENNEINVPAERSVTIPFSEVTVTQNLQSDEANSGLKLIYNQAMSRARKRGLFPNVNCSFINRTNPDFDQLRSENERLLTFHDWPQTAFVSPDDLAREGLFYTGTGDRVQCAYCRGYIREWEPTDIPREEHKKHFPTCSFVLGREASRNEIINENTIAVTASEQTQAAKGSYRIDPSVVEARMDTWNVRQVINMGFSRDKVKAAIEAKLSTTGVAAFENVQSLLDAILLLDNTETEASTAAAALPERMASVSTPETASISVYNSSCLASASASSSSSGFFALNYSTANRNPTVNKDNITGPSALGQLPLISGESPQFPEYTDYDRRVASFQGRIVGKGQTKEGLAEAGFSYAGLDDDKVQCFHCGGNLRDWEEGEDPWEKHKMFHGHCQYIKTHEAPNRSNKIKALMDTPTVRIILDMGYVREKVEFVISKGLLTTVDYNPNAENLLEALFQLEEQTVAIPPEATASALTPETAETDNTSEQSNVSSTASAESPESSEKKKKKKKKQKKKKKKQTSAATSASIGDEAVGEMSIQTSQNDLEMPFLNEETGPKGK